MSADDYRNVSIDNMSDLEQWRARVWTAHCATVRSLPGIDTTDRRTYGVMLSEKAAEFRGAWAMALCNNLSSFRLNVLVNMPVLEAVEAAAQQRAVTEAAEHNGGVSVPTC